MPSIKRIKASNESANASAPTITAIRAPGATTLHVDTVAGIYAGTEGFLGTMGAPHTFEDPITGETITVISEETAVDFQGHVDVGNIEIDTIAPGYTDAGSKVGDIVVIRPTTQWADNLSDVMAEAHDDDGKLKAAVPVTGSAAFTVEPLTGWINDPNTFVYWLGTGLPTAVIKVVGKDVTDHLQVGMPFVAVQDGTPKYGFITQITFSTDSFITAFMSSTNGTVDNGGITGSTITSFKFGLPKRPGLGFPLDPARWTVSLVDTSDRTQTGASTGAWYNLGSLSLSIPAGIWHVSYQTSTYGNSAVSRTGYGVFTTLSTSTNAQSDKNLTSYAQTDGSSGTLTIDTPTSRHRIITLTELTTYYLLAMSNYGGSGGILTFKGGSSPTIIEAICAYL